MKEQKLSTLLTDELAVTVYFDYQPEEPETANYPGCSAVVELNSVCLGKNNIMPVLSQKVLGSMADQCMESMESD